MSLAAVKGELSGEYVWSLQGAPIRIHTPLRVIEQLRLCLDSSNSSERGGMLLGQSRGGRVDISGFELFDRKSGDPHFNLSESEMQEFAAQIRKRSQEVVGYFRTDLRGQVRLTDEDLSIINQHFRNSKHVFLVLSTDEMRDQVGGFFFWDGETLFSELSFKQFSLDPRRLAARSTPPAEPASLSAKPTPAPAPAQTRQARSSRPPWMRTAALVTAALAVGLVATHLASRYVGREPDQPRPTASSPDAVFGPSLLVSAQRTGNSVSITWDSASPALADTRMAVVSVQDGSSKQEFALTQEQFRTNKLVYFPQSRQLDVVVEAFLKSGGMVKEAIVVAVGETSVRSRTVSPSVQPSTAPTTVVAADTPVESKPSVRPFDVGGLRTRPSAPERTVEYVPPPENSPLAVAGVNVKAPEFLPGGTVPASLSRVPAPARPEVAAPALLQAARPLRRIQPVVPANIVAMLKKTTSVHVRVRVDAAGKVTAAEPLSPAPGIGQYLATTAAATARLWTFAPARQGNTPVPSELILKFDFDRK